MAQQSYPVIDEVVERFIKAVNNENDNPLFIMSRQSGKTTALIRFIERLDREGRDMRIGVYSTSWDCAKEVVSYIRPTSGAVSVVPLSKMHIDGDFDLVIISEAYFVEQDKLTWITERYPYVAVTSSTLHGGGGVPARLSETIDRRWYVDGEVIQAYVPPWIDLEEVLKRIEEVEERRKAFEVEMVLHPPVKPE